MPEAHGEHGTASIAFVNQLALMLARDSLCYMNEEWVASRRGANLGSLLLTSMCIPDVAG